MYLYGCELFIDCPHLCRHAIYIQRPKNQSCLSIYIYKQKNVIGHLGILSIFTYHFSSQNYQRQIKPNEISWFHVLGFMLQS
jgi:hypothetical protein